MKLLFVVVVVFQISIFVFGISDQVNYFSDSYATARLRFKEEANVRNSLAIIFIYLFY
jgi:hypothetical protein